MKVTRAAIHVFECQKGQACPAAGPSPVRPCVKDGCRKQESETTFYRWKKRFGRLWVSERREFRQLGNENRKLKQLLADLSLDTVILQQRLEMI